MRLQNIFGIFMVLVISGCTTPEAKQIEAAAATPVVGADKDEHGCIGSAGYSWCASTNQCERPWELAQKNGFAQTTEGFNSFCNTH